MGTPKRSASSLGFIFVLQEVADWGTSIVFKARRVAMPKHAAHAENAAQEAQIFRGTFQPLEFYGLRESWLMKMLMGRFVDWVLFSND